MGLDESYLAPALNEYGDFELTAAERDAVRRAFNPKAIRRLAEEILGRPRASFEEGRQGARRGGDGRIRVLKAWSICAARVRRRRPPATSRNIGDLDEMYLPESTLENLLKQYAYADDDSAAFRVGDGALRY